MVADGQGVVSENLTAEDISKLKKIVDRMHFLAVIRPRTQASCCMEQATLSSWVVNQFPEDVSHFLACATPSGTDYLFHQVNKESFFRESASKTGHV